MIKKNVIFDIFDNIPYPKMCKLKKKMISTMRFISRHISHNSLLVKLEYQGKITLFRNIKLNSLHPLIINFLKDVPFFVRF